MIEEKEKSETKQQSSENDKISQIIPIDWSEMEDFLDSDDDQLIGVPRPQPDQSVIFATNSDCESKQKRRNRRPTSKKKKNISLEGMPKKTDSVENFV